MHENLRNYTDDTQTFPDHDTPTKYNTREKEQRKGRGGRGWHPLGKAGAGR